jgi:hypothetical protein
LKKGKAAAKAQWFTEERQRSSTGAFSAFLCAFALKWVAFQTVFALWRVLPVQAQRATKQAAATYSNLDNRRRGLYEQRTQLPC